MDGTLRFAHPTTRHCRNDGDFWIRARVLAARCVRGLRHLRPSQEKRAQGRPGARCTRGLVCKVHKGNAHEHTGSGRQSGLPCADGFNGFLRALPGDEFLLSPSSRGLTVLLKRPGRARKTSADLTPATGARTTRLRRPQHAPLVPRAAWSLTGPMTGPPCNRLARDDAVSVHRIPPTSVTIATRPLWRVVWRELYR